MPNLYDLIKTADVVKLATLDMKSGLDLARRLKESGYYLSSSRNYWIDLGIRLEHNLSCFYILTFRCAWFGLADRDHPTYSEPPCPEKSYDLEVWEQLEDGVRGGRVDDPEVLESAKHGTVSHLYATLEAIMGLSPGRPQQLSLF